jgi:AcrR family transcriptional regulator
MDTIKEKILDEAKKLFLSQGYSQTTTRQILAKAGIQNGSLYHFFKNKEDIFKHLISDLFDEGMRIAEKIAGKDANPVLNYAITLSMELYATKKYDRLAELYYEAYRSWTVLEILTQKGAIRNKTLFKSYNPDFTDNDYYVRTLAVKGCVYAFLAEGFYSGGVSFQDKTETLLETSLSLFNVPMSEIKNAIQKSCSIVKKKRIVIMGFNI